MSNRRYQLRTSQERKKRAPYGCSSPYSNPARKSRASPVTSTAKSADISEQKLDEVLKTVTDGFQLVHRKLDTHETGFDGLQSASQIRHNSLPNGFRGGAAAIQNEIDIGSSEDENEENDTDIVFHGEFNQPNNAAWKSVKHTNSNPNSILGTATVPNPTSKRW